MYKLRATQGLVWLRAASGSSTVPGLSTMLLVSPEAVQACLAASLEG